MIGMNYEMRRKKQQLSPEECNDILDRNTAGVLSLLDPKGYPYGVPLSYCRVEDRLLFHSALTGHKLDAIQHEERASFCVIDQDQVVPEQYTTYYRSVIAFGTVRILEQEEEKRAAIEALAEKYAPNLPEGREQEIRQEYHHFCMIELKMEQITGKEAIELHKQRNTQ